MTRVQTLAIQRTTSARPTPKPSNSQSEVSTSKAFGQRPAPSSWSSKPFPSILIPRCWKGKGLLFSPQPSHHVCWLLQRRDQPLLLYPSPAFSGRGLGTSLFISPTTGLRPKQRQHTLTWLKSVLLLATVVNSNKKIREDVISLLVLSGETKIAAKELKWSAKTIVLHSYLEGKKSFW